MATSDWWVNMPIDLADDLKVVHIAAQCGMSPDEVVGKLVRLWGWAKRNAKRKAKSGTITGTPDEISVTLEFLGEAIVTEKFIVALQSVGWVRVSECQIQFMNSAESLAQVQTKKEQARVRQARKRARDKRVAERVDSLDNHSSQ